jgi:Mannosyltransferase (PIG-V)
MPPDEVMTEDRAQVTGAAGGTITKDPPRHRTAQAGPTEVLRRFWEACRLPFWISTSRIGVGVVFAHLVLTLFPQSIQHLGFGTLNNGTWFGAFDRWDSAYYTGIAAHGYPKGVTQTSAFFPGYPGLIRVVHEVTFGTLSYLQAAMVVSWIALIAASILLYRLTRKHFDERTALIATGLFCWFPASLFYLAPYSEALLVLEILVVVTMLDRKWFLGASLVAAYSSATSPQAVVLIIAIVVAAFLAGRGLLRIIGFAAISCSGLIAYGLYLWSRYGSPIEFDKVQSQWHRSENLPFFGLYRNIVALEHFFQGPGPPPGGTIPTYANIKYVWLLDDAALVIAAVLVIGLVVLAARPLWAPARVDLIEGERPSTISIPAPFVVVGVGILLIAACTTIYPYGTSTFASTEGEARFVSVIFPIYMVGAYALRRRTGLLLWALGLSVAVTLLFQGLFNLGYWIT